MKKLVLMAALAALSACNEKAEEAPAATDTAMAEATPMADATVAPGTYDVKMADGTMGKTVINADGTYVDTDKDGKISATEFAAAHEGSDEKFAAHDPNGDGFIDADEMKAHHQAKGADKSKMEGKCGEGKCGGSM